MGTLSEYAECFLRMALSGIHRNPLGPFATLYFFYIFNVFTLSSICRENYRYEKWLPTFFSFLAGKLVKIFPFLSILEEMRFWWPGHNEPYRFFFSEEKKRRGKPPILYLQNIFPFRYGCHVLRRYFKVSQLFTKKKVDV